MNAHFSNAVNAVAFTWGTQKVYHAAQFDPAADDPGNLRHDSVRQHEKTNYHVLRNLASLGLSAAEMELLGPTLWMLFGGLPSVTDPTTTHHDDPHDAYLQQRLHANQAPVGTPKLPDFLQHPFEPGDAGPAVQDDPAGRFQHPDDELEEEDVEPAVIDEHNYGTRGLSQPYYKMQSVADVPRPASGRAYGVRKFANTERKPAMFSEHFSNAARPLAFSWHD